ncbi:MAG: hypothetical protein OXG44_07590 [Gammaproteobacteria bacterium]|nr:hypothetical protein [Gammaproteobacteria bacterium]
MIADSFELDSLRFPVEKLEATRPASTHREINGQVGCRFARPVAERVTMLYRVDRFCPTPCTRPLLLDGTKRSS